MKIENNENKLVFTYKLVEGINSTKGGVNVLKQLDYPENIISNTEKILENTFNE